MFSIQANPFPRNHAELQADHAAWRKIFVDTGKTVCISSLRIAYYLRAVDHHLSNKQKLVIACTVLAAFGPVRKAVKLAAFSTRFTITLALG